MTSTFSTNLLDSKPGQFNNLLSAPAPAVSAPEMRDFGDVDATRRAIYDDVFKAASSLEPVSNKRHTLKLTNVRYDDPDVYSLKQEKEAILAGRSLGRRLKGTWELYDNTTGDLLDRRDQVVAAVPYFTRNGTFIHNGNQYGLRNQQRMRAGIYAREKENGELETHVNILPGKGPSHRYFLDPEKSVFYMRLGQSNMPLFPILKELGATPKQLRDAFGDEIYNRNLAKDDGAVLKKLKAKLLKAEDLKDEITSREAIRRVFNNMEVDPEVTKYTLGKPYQRMDVDTIIASVQKLLKIRNREAEVDDRDSLAYQQFIGPEDLFSERLRKDYGGIRRQLLFKASMKNSLKNMPSSALKPQLEAALLSSGLGQPLEEINPSEIYDKLYAISRMGEGGIPSLDSIPDEARNVQPSHMGYMDPVRTPESFRAGVDVFMARNSRKGRDGKIYAQFYSPKEGKEVWKTPQEVRSLALTTPDTLRLPWPLIPVIKDGKYDYVAKDKVDLVVPRFEEAFSPLGNIVPLKSQVKPQRMAMASRMLTQALPLVDAEAPLVQSAIPGTNGSRSYEDEYAKHMGSKFAEQPGKVLNVTPDAITVQYADGRKEDIELYNTLPFNRKTFLHQTAAIKPGERFEAGQMLAYSNYTDKKTGATALGKNFRVAYIPWQGLNFEDAIVISETAAKKLSSEHAYQHELEKDEKTTLGKKAYVSVFAGKFPKTTLERMDEHGRIKPGEKVEYGDPLILGIRQRELTHNKVHKKGQGAYVDASVLWEHHDPGIVTDVVDGKTGPVVVVKSVSSMQVGDKLSGRYGDKGVVSAIIPDHQMPQDAEGAAYEVLLNPLGIVSRTNPAQKMETALGKLALKLGRPIKVEDYRDDIDDYEQWTEQELSKHGVKLYDDIVDPTRRQKIKNVATGMRFLMKLHHTAESKNQARGGGSYTTDETPAKGGASGSKRVALLDTNALLAHGAVENLRDVGAVRGQKNEQYWLQFMQGHTPENPRVPMVYEKFVNQLKAAGINVVKSGPKLNFMAMTNRDVAELAGDREVKSGETVNWDGGLKPIPGGLFDPQLTGGHNGNRWSFVKLHTPLPNPVMEEPIRRILGLTGKQFEDVLTGAKSLPGVGSGPAGIAKALGNIDLDKELAKTRAQLLASSHSERDQAIRKLGYLKSAQKLGIHPKDWVLDRAPVLPPVFRPVTMMGNKMPLVADPNYLYRELIEANQNLKTMEKEVGGDAAGIERLALYNSFKAVVGLGDPLSQKSQEKGVKGLLANIFGSSPKLGTVQRKLLSTTVDNVGRSVITPDPDLDMDSVGLPEDKAFDVYSKFIARRLRRQGMPLLQALKHIVDRSDQAKKALLTEMESRPVFINRAPVLHKFGVLAFWPRLVKGDTMRVSPLIVKGFGADFDGDAMNFHVPTEDAARKEAIERLLPSKSLLSPADFKTPVHMPGNEFVGGLFFATHNDTKSKRAVRVFRRLADAKAAAANGDLNLNDEIQILET